MSRIQLAVRGTKGGVPRRGARAVVVLALGMAVLAPVAGHSDSLPPNVPAAAAPAENTDAEAQAVLAKLRQCPDARAGKTARGQTIDQAPKFTVLPRKSLLTYYPCTQCHDPAGQPNEHIRVLKDMHTDLTFEHGGGRFWCYACHDSKNMDTLASLRGTPVDFDQAYKICGQCHFEREMDWAFGGHGKRAGAFPDPRAVPLTHDKLLVRDRSQIGHWRGKRVLLDCTACHNPHRPAIGPFPPSPPPLVRTGLSRPDGKPIAATAPGLPLGSTQR